MKVTFKDQTLSFFDLPVSTQNHVNDELVIRVKESAEMMKEIREMGSSTKDEVDTAIELMVDAALSNVKIYCDFDVTMEVA